jgi:hypothetical protein
MRQISRSASALVVFGTLVVVAANIWHLWSSPDGHYYNPGHYLHRDGDWLRVQRWARQETGRGDTFLVPPHYEGFRVFSERPVVGEWKDGAAVIWQPEYAGHWRDWYRSHGGTFERSYSKPIWSRLHSAWMATPPGGVLAIALRFGATHIVLDKEYFKRHGWPGRPVYAGDRFFVVRAQ